MIATMDQARMEGVLGQPLAILVVNDRRNAWWSWVSSSCMGPLGPAARIGRSSIEGPTDADSDGSPDSGAG